jgi:serine/arginine repetitive matrix protein 2
VNLSCYHVCVHLSELLFFRYEMYIGDLKPAISVTADVESPDTPTSGSNPGVPHNLEPGTAVEVLELANGETIW